MYCLLMSLDVLLTCESDVLLTCACLSVLLTYESDILLTSESGCIAYLGV